MKDVGWVEHKRDPPDLIAMANALWNYIGPGVRGNSRRASESSVVSRLLVAVVLKSVANAVGTTCRGFESHQLHFLPMRHLRGCSSAGRAVPFHNSRRHDFGRTAGRRNDEQKTNRSRMLAGTTFTVSCLGKHTCRLFFRQLGNRRQMLAGLHGRALAKARGPGPTPGGFARSHSSETMSRESCCRL